MDQLLGFWSNGHVLHTKLLRLDAPFVVMPRVVAEFWGPNSAKPVIYSTGWFLGPYHQTRVSTAPRARRPRPDACSTSPRPHRQHGPLHHVLTRVRVPRVSYYGWSVSQDTTLALHPSVFQLKEWSYHVSEIMHKQSTIVIRHDNSSDTPSLGGVGRGPTN